MPAITTIRVRKGTSTEWSTANPILSSGEIGFDTTNKLIKVGDGSSAWSSLTNTASFSLLDVDNLRLDGNTLSVTNADGSLVLSQNGAGNINLTTSSNTTGNIFLNNSNIKVGNGSATTSIFTTSNTSNLVLATNNNTTSANIAIQSGTNGNVIVSSPGTGNINITTSTNTAGNININNANLKVGNGSATSNIFTTSNTSNLVLATNLNSSSSNIAIQAGANGNVIISSPGTGNINLTTSTNTSGNININNTNIKVGNGSLTTNIFTTTSTSNLRLATNLGSSSAIILIGSGSSGNINLSTSTNTTGSIFLNSTNIRTGNGSAITNITTTTNTSALTLSTNNNSSSASITIFAGSDGQINITPGGTGSVLMGVNNSVAGATYSTVMGTGATTRLLGEIAHSGGTFGSAGGGGLSQHSIFNLNKWIGNDASNILLTLDGGTPTSSNKLILPGTGGGVAAMWTFCIKVSATFLADNTYFGGWIINGAIKNTWGPIALIGSVTTETWLDSEITTASVSVTANDTDKTLDIKVSTPTITGETLVESYWSSVVDVCQISYIP